MKLVQKISAGYAVILAFMIIISIVAYNSLISIDHSVKWVNHTNEVIDIANSVGGSMIDMETGLRGFLITGEENYLEPYYAGINKFDKLIEDGKKKTSDNPEAVKQLEDIKNIEYKWTKYSKKMIALREEVLKGEYAIEHFKKVSARTLGKELFDAIRIKLANLDKKFGDEHKGKDLVMETTLALVNMETGQRGFLLSGKEESLEPYINGKKDLVKSLDMMQSIISNTKVTYSDINDIKYSVDEWQRKVADVEISARKAMNQYTITNSDITNEIKKDEGKTNMDAIREVLNKFIENERKLLTQREQEQYNTILFGEYFTIIGNILTILICIIMAFSIHRNINSLLARFQNDLMDFFDYLNEEKDDIKLLDQSTNDEIGIMSIAVNKGIERTKINMQHKEIENWNKTGITELNQILINLNTQEEISNGSITFISNYINAGVGVFYIYDEIENSLFQNASFAHVVRDELSTKFKLGEGVVGQVAMQKAPILLKNIKKDEALITTGTITQHSYSTYTFPLIYNSKLYGVIEIGSFEPFEEKVLNFLNSIDKTICISLSIAIQNKKVQELLDTTKKANEELEIVNINMQKQQQQLEEANASMEEQQQQLEEANANMEEQQQQLEEANASMEEQQQHLIINEQNLKLQNKQLEDTKKEIEQKAEELILSSKYKSEFLANMSHELRTPLNSIILLSSLLKRNSKNTLVSDDIKKAKTIFESGNELLRLINDVLDLSKVESGKMEVIVDSFDSSKFLEQMKDVFDFTAVDKGLEFKIVDEYKDIIHSDKDRISQIVRNLISNAFKFTKEGSITLKIAPSKDSQKEIEISVIDTGIGIPKTKQDHIFKAFTQADGSTSREYGGTGLGLSISRELSHLLGGTIGLTSQEGKGSTFSINLPLLESTNSKKIEEKVFKKEETSILKKETKVDFQQSNIKDDRKNLKDSDEAYLIIDDDKPFAEVVYDEIKESGSSALIALDGASGLELIKQYNIKGIMLDLTLPDMDGVDILKVLKSNNETRHIPVHIISSKDKDTHTLELGAIGYLQKPVVDGDIDEVISSINHFQEKKIKDLLIVEDDKVHREALIELVGEGVNIKGVQNASQAINEVKKEIYDTVVVDLGLIEGSGYEVCEYIKNTHPELPIIIYTGRDLTNDDKAKLLEYSNSIIIKTANSNERILNEINLFLHRDERINQNKEEVVMDSINLEDRKILVVDDDIKNIFVLEAALQEFNATTYSAFNGKEALDLLIEKNDIDLVLMDIMMPVMDGYEAIKQIRENETIKHIPIIAVTAKAMKEDREKCISLGADDYMSKPIDLNILGDLINQWSLKKHK